MTQKEFLDKAIQAAIDGNHVHPTYAACEAALESRWGNSKLCIKANNLFGLKKPKNYTGETVRFDTWEVINGKIETVKGVEWVKYPDWKSSFTGRMDTLRRLSRTYPDYAAALQAETGEEFVRLVSRTWSTDPHRADKVLSIHKQWIENN